MRPYYEDDLVTLYLGDCREILPHLAGDPGDMTLSDPPYGMGYRHGARKGGVLLGADGQAIVGDDVPFDPSHLIKSSPRVVLWGANHYADSLPRSPGWLVWDKRDGGPVMDQSDCELAWTNFLTTARVFSRRWSGAARGGREQAEGRLHVNQKPVALMDWCISWAPGVQRVIDPYVGSGATLVAAKERGIRAVGIEIVEQHCETTAQRLSQGILAL